MVHIQTRIRPEEWDAKNSLGFWNVNRSANPDPKTRSSDSKKQKTKDIPPQKKTAVKWTLAFQGTTERRSKKAKRETNLPDN